MLGRHAVLAQAEAGPRRAQRQDDGGAGGEAGGAHVGLMWDSRSNSHPPNDAAWEAQLTRLVAYRAVHGDCNVPQRWPGPISMLYM
jgi:hypothetical protein